MYRYLGTDEEGNVMKEEITEVAMDDVIIVNCTKHQVGFIVHAQAHLDGVGCPLCDKRSVSDLRRIIGFIA